ncbi:hypothetical protein ACQ4PT_005664 [Festuca glaucescens]
MPKQILNSKITSTHAVVHPISLMTLGCIYILYSEYSLVWRTAGSGWLWCNIKCLVGVFSIGFNNFNGGFSFGHSGMPRLTAGSRDAAKDRKMQYNGRYWISRPHQRPQAPNGSGALALIGDSSSSAFVPDISSLDKSLRHCFTAD